MTIKFPQDTIDNYIAKLLQQAIADGMPPEFSSNFNQQLFTEIALNSCIEFDLDLVQAGYFRSIPTTSQTHSDELAGVLKSFALSDEEARNLVWIKAASFARTPGLFSEALKFIKTHNYTTNDLTNIAKLLNSQVVKSSTTELGYFTANTSREKAPVHSLLKDGDFEFIASEICANGLSFAQITAITDISYFGSKFFLLTASQDNYYVKTAVFSKEDFSSLLKIVSKHDIKLSHLDSIVTAMNNGYVNGFQDLDQVLSNLAKYDQISQPWSVWFQEILGFKAEGQISKLDYDAIKLDIDDSEHLIPNSLVEPLEH